MTILAALGWTLLGALALVGLVVLGVVLWLWRSYRTVANCIGPFDATPGHFVLHATHKPQAPQALERLQIDAENVGGFKLDTDIGELAVSVLLTRAQRVLVVLVSAPEHGEWVMTHAIRPGGRLATWTNAYGRFHAAWSPGASVVHWPGAEVAQLLDAADGLASATPFPAQLRELRDLYARELVASWTSRYLHGPGEFSWSDLLPYKPEKRLDTEQWRAALAEAAPRKLAELCATGFVYSSNLSVSRWAEHRDRLLFVHEHMPVSALTDAGEWTPFVHVTDRLGKSLAKLNETTQTTNAVDALEQANQDLAVDDRYDHLANFEWPIRGALYAAPVSSCSLFELDELDTHTEGAS